jgi:hypothetical protein
MFAVQELVRSGWVAVDQGGGRSNTNAFRFAFDRLEDPETVQSASPFPDTETVNSASPFSEETVQSTTPFSQERVKPASLETVKPTSPFRPERVKGNAQRVKGASPEHTNNSRLRRGESDAPARAPEGAPLAAVDETTLALEFETWWSEYPLRVGRRGAWREYIRIRSTGEATVAELADGAKRYAREREGQEKRYTRMPAKWLKEGHWCDEPQEPRSTGSKGQQGVSRTRRVMDKYRLGGVPS